MLLAAEANGTGQLVEAIISGEGVTGDEPGVVVVGR